MFPLQGGLVRPQLQKILSGLGKYCANREESGAKRKAPPCSKQDLETIVRLLYTTASTESEYLDAALVVMMWYLYGRSSDAEQVEKQQLSVLPGGVLFLRFKRVETALLQGISLFKDPTSFLTCPLHALAAATVMQSTPAKRMFPQFVAAKRTTQNVQDLEELTLVELLEAEDDPEHGQIAPQSAPKPKIPGAQAYVNRLLVRAQEEAKFCGVRLTPGLTSHSFRRGGAMHANDGSVAENWITERGGWQLDRVNKAFGYILGTTQADQQVSRVLSGWKPKDGARLPSLAVLDLPVQSQARKVQALLFANTLDFEDPALNLDEDVADVLTATLLMNYPDMLRLSDSSPLVIKIREGIAERSIAESEVLTWSTAIRNAFMPPPEVNPPPVADASDQLSVLLELTERQTDQIGLLILQNKRLEERLFAVELQLRPKNRVEHVADTSQSSESSAVEIASIPTASKPPRSKRKGTQSLASIWFEWFTAEPRVFAAQSVKKTALYEFRHTTGYLMLFLPMGFALDASSPAYKGEALAFGKTAQDNALAFLKSHGSSAIAASTALKAFRQLHKQGKLDDLIVQFHELLEAGSITDPTPSAALPSFIRLRPSSVL